MSGRFVHWPTVFDREWAENLELRPRQGGCCCCHDSLAVLVTAKNNQSFTVQFHGVLSYRVTCEQFLSPDFASTPRPSESSVSFKWENSAWLNDLKEGGTGMPEAVYGSADLSHYVIVSNESVIEVVAAKEPTIESFENGRIANNGSGQKTAK